uniref:Uncharacterized protein n=1 Tax=uncultured bacterium contig00086 TaxID=1181559 RepID=A0A806K1D4_9BACT|nr:hypothetical protein [uncultured bacterium contig00086]
MIARWFSELKKGILAFIGALRDRGAALRMPDQEKLQRIASQLLPEGARRKDKRSVNLFARLVLWGIETLGVQWKPSFAPGEYCGLMAAALPTAAEAGSETDSETAETPPETPHNIEIRSGIFRSGELFEKAIYSLRRLSAEEEKEYKQLIDDITGYEQ